MNPFEQVISSLAGVPVLHGARCRNRHHLFDPAGPDEPDDQVAARHAQATELCRACPALNPCREWFYSLPRNRRPLGVIAAQLSTRTHRRKTAS